MSGGEGGGNIAELRAGGCCRNAEGKKLQKWWRGRGEGMGFAEMGGCLDSTIFIF